jgi:hypothetical protein
MLLGGTVTFKVHRVLQTGRVVEVYPWSPYPYRVQWADTNGDIKVGSFTEDDLTLQGGADVQAISSGD